MALNADFGVIDTKTLGITVTMPELSLPDARTQNIEVMGRDGDLDTTSWYGPVSYGDRTVIINMHDQRPLATRRAARARLQTAIHGKERDLILSDEPDKTITGRWSVGYSETGAITEYVITGRCKPFRSMGWRAYRINAMGGVEIVVDGGDDGARPIIEVNHIAKVAYKGEEWTLDPGASMIVGLFLDEGPNVLYINTLPDAGETTWQQLKDDGITWAEFATKRPADWRQYLSGPVQLPYTWQMLHDMGVTWAEFSTKAPIEWRYQPDPTDPTYTAYIAFERKVF